MKRKLLALAIAVAIAVVAAPMALAAGTNGHPAKPVAKGKPFLAKGTVVSVDATAGTLVVTVSKGSHNMKPSVGTDVTFTLAAGAHLFARTVGPDGKLHFKRATLDQLTPGSEVNINGRVGRSDGDRSDPAAAVYFARHIVVKLAPAPTPAPSPTETPSPEPAS
jgi:hypothetical protein